ncbi:prepilin-type N-terminal cleavage/methylation domain-containing protein [Tichowtungia aerotolerans]|uniref:Prepilin-type N-terminal cleavage/methylation domain-containing protein n=1 Tax=Tichowtungia aerotolerans TaxID=2697043 RepID=A0A6P1MFS0_9BACT|nr:prepilin-type N-terminal cleavage/methylation domain-containing protein [Tichowtungia aerotolerans]QHI70456.1 prepilin-type N-terminal cleavage/methylation domain-containing protein [Tichowtungia aerotolerans]
MHRRGFTLLEIMVAIVILSIAMTVAWQTFSSATRSWTSARRLMDETHHGDFVLTQLTAALRSMAFFDSLPEQYGFRMERNRDGEYGEHSISWVTASKAFLPKGTEFDHGMHRIEVGAGEDDDGNDGLLVTVWRHIADEDDDVEKQSWVVSDVIKGLGCAVYNVKDEKWDEEWEETNAIPGLIEITLYADPKEEGDDPIEYRQLIEIPLGPPVTNEVDAASQ